MTDKDPKDMTAAELLREADSNPCSMCHLVMTGDESCATTGCASWAYRLADKIDAEIVKAYSEKLNTCAMRWAKANGWPDFRDREDFGAWLERCTYKKPVDDCNEPVQFGDEIELHSDGGDFYSGRFQEINISRGPVRLFSFTGVDHEHLRRYDTECDVIKRPAPEVLLGDGKPVSKGETVYVTDSGIERTVKDFDTKLCEGMDGWDGSPWVMFDNGSWMHARELTHTPPDTQERIDADARKDQFEYWQCRERECDECPAEIEGMSPKKRYGCNDCCSAMTLDLLRRQRELDARKGGAE